MKKYALAFFLTFVLVVSLACTSPVGLFATPTPMPTYTPLPTYTPFPSPTPIPPTATPLPKVAGIDVPLKINGMYFTVIEVSFVTSYQFSYVDANGKFQTATLTTKDPNDRIMVIDCHATGELQNTSLWHNVPVGTETVHVTNSAGRSDNIWVSRWDKNKETAVLIFVVSGSIDDHILHFPDGQEIDLASFLE